MTNRPYEDNMNMYAVVRTPDNSRFLIQNCAAWMITGDIVEFTGTYTACRVYMFG